MIDDEDVEFAALAWSPTGPISIVVGLIVLGILWCLASKNDDECAARHCPRGHAVIVRHECVCLETPQ